GALAVVRRDFEAGMLGPADVATLSGANRSVPTGILQDWPDGAPVTVQTLLNLMISISDNTATDAVIALVGGERIAETPGGPAPLLTPRALFHLKGPEGEGLLARWRDGDEAARRAVLAELPTLPLPPLLSASPQPYAL